MPLLTLPINLTYPVEWKPIPFHHGYCISNYGHVWWMGKQKQMNISYDVEEGFASVQLPHEQDITTLYIHELVANAFIPNANPRLKVKHINRDRTNNQIDNLCWIPSEEEWFWNKYS